MESMVKQRIAVTITDEMLKWVDSEVKKTTFANRSHAVEHALMKLRKSEEKEFVVNEAALRTDGYSEQQIETIKRETQRLMRAMAEEQK